MITYHNEISENDFVNFVKQIKQINISKHSLVAITKFFQTDLTTVILIQTKYLFLKSNLTSMDFVVYTTDGLNKKHTNLQISQPD